MRVWKTWLERLGRVQKIPRRRGTIREVRDGLPCPVLVQHRMISIEEGLPVETGFFEGLAHQLQNQLIGMRCRLTGDHLDLRRIDAQPVIFDIGALNPDRGFKLPVLDRIGFFRGFCASISPR